MNLFLLFGLLGIKIVPCLPSCSGRDFKAQEQARNVDSGTAHFPELGANPVPILDQVVRR